jgi:hypothetical protein
VILEGARSRFQAPAPQPDSVALGSGFIPRPVQDFADAKILTAGPCRRDGAALGLESLYLRQDAAVRPEWIRQRRVVIGLVLLALCGCHHAKSPVVTQADVAAAQEEAQKEFRQAQVEARKDVKSAAKVAGADSREAAHARITGAFDIAMARADGAHKVAVERCLTLEPTAQQACKDQADADYQAAANSAKAMRVAQQQQPQQ